MTEAIRAPFHLHFQRFNKLRAHVMTVGMTQAGFRELECVLCPEEAQHQIFDIVTRVALKVSTGELDLSIVSEEHTAIFGGDFGILDQLGFTERKGVIRIIFPDAKGIFMHELIDPDFKFQWDPIDMIGFDGMDINKEVKILGDSLARVQKHALNLLERFDDRSLIGMLICAMFDAQTQNKKIIQALGKRGLIDNTKDLGFELDEEIHDNVFQIFERFAHALKHGKTVEEVGNIPREEL